MSKNKTPSQRSTLSYYLQAVRPYRATAASFIAILLASYVCETLIPWFYKSLFDTLTSPGPRAALVPALLRTIGIITALAGGRWLLRRFTLRLDASVSCRVMGDLVKSSFDHVSRQSYKFFTNSFAGSLVKKIQRFSGSFQSLSDMVAYTILPMFITVGGSFAMLAVRSWGLAAIFAGWVGLAIAFNTLMAKKTWRLRAERAAKDSEMTGVLSDSIGNSLNAKLFSGLGHESALVAKVTDELQSIRRRNWLQSDKITMVQVGLMVIVESSVISFCIIGWGKGLISVGDFVLVQTIIARLSGSVWSLSQVFKQWNDATADAQEMTDLLNQEPEIKDAPRAKKLKATAGRIDFSDVGFNYSETRPVLEGFTLSVAPKEKVALVGASGAGKSTVVKLLFRFYDLTAGKILIDGQDVSKVTQDSLHDALAMVPQEPLLFHRPLLENIRYGRRDATDEEVYEAAKKAHCHEFISSLPEGYATLVGERGVKLSGGERQRVAIARAILKNAPILVLDEATSSLDSESEHLIHEALRELMRDKTVIVIAHRLSTIMEMDRIVVVEGGGIADMGTHQELLGRGGTYKKLWEIQAGGFIADEDEV